MVDGGSMDLAWFCLRKKASLRLDRASRCHRNRAFLPDPPELSHSTGCTLYWGFPSAHTVRIRCEKSLGSPLTSNHSLEGGRRWACSERGVFRPWEHRPARRVQVVSILRGAEYCGVAAHFHFDVVRQIEGLRQVGARPAKFELAAALRRQAVVILRVWFDA